MVYPGPRNKAFKRFDVLRNFPPDSGLHVIFGRNPGDGKGAIADPMVIVIIIFLNGMILELSGHLWVPVKPAIILKTSAKDKGN
jgi:hypothetical protein